MNKTLINIIYVIMFLGLAFFLLYSTSLNYIVDGRPLFPEETQNKTAVYVRFLAIFLAICCGALAIRTFLDRAKEQEKLDFIKNPTKFFLLIAILITYTLGIHYLGFFISTAVYLPVTMYAMGYRKHHIIVLSSLLLILFIYALFVHIFEVPLPEAALF